MGGNPYDTPMVRAGRVALAVFCTAIFFFLIAPIIIIIPLSFNSVPFFTYPLDGFSLRWYAEIIGDSPISLLWQRAIVNSLIIGLSSTFLATVLGVLAAFGLSRTTFRVKGAVMTVLISPLFVPIIVTAVGMFYFYAWIGLVNNLASIILAHTVLGAPFVVITVTATLTAFDYNLVRASYILGARQMRTFFKVTLPIILPGVVSGALFAFATSWDEIVVVLFLAGPEQHTIPRRMWSGIRELISPSIIAAATLLIVVSAAMMLAMEWLRRRGDRLRGTRS